MAPDLEALKKEILAKVALFQRTRANGWPSFDKAKPQVPVSGKVFDEEDLCSLVDASLDFWLTTGRFHDQFESGLAARFGLKHACMVNSGSSANLVAVSALTSRFLGDSRLKKGDEVITTAMSFPTTVNPIFQNGLVPVFVDVDIETGNVDASKAEKAITKKTRAMVLTHTLGNPFDAERLSKACKENNMFLVEDCCDAFGSLLNGKPVGSFGDIATLSFYPAHHITTGEGGAVLTNSDLLKRAAESFRDWGRDCWCKTGCNNTCGKRFGWKMGGLPYGYDHKYIYSNIGYNLKATDMQAAIGVSQLKKADEFIRLRKENFNFYLNNLKKHGRFLRMPSSLPGTDPSPFGFTVIVKGDAPFKRNDLVTHLESMGVHTRMLFGGNIVRQPAYQGENYRVAGELANSDYLLENAFWIGVYPGISQEMREYAASAFDSFFSKF